MTKTPEMESEIDTVLEEVRRTKEKLSASYGHDLRKLFEITREHQKASGRPAVSFEDKAS